MDKYFDREGLVDTIDTINTEKYHIKITECGLN